MNFAGLINKWNSLSTTQKTVLVVMILAVILASIFFVQWLLRVEYGELFTNLDVNGAAQVVNKLQEMGVPYKLTNQGTTITVPKDQIYELRLQLASSGVIASGGSGFELFDQSKLGITDFERQLNYIRALQEELRRSIIQLEAVEQARVHLVVPEQSLFIRDQGQASASIVLKLAPIATLHPSQVLAIINLVAGSVDKLDPRNVHVIDTQGRILSEGLIDDSGSFVVAQRKQYEQKRIFEREMEQRIQALLQSILGIGQSVTMVTAELDFDQREVTKIVFGDSHIRSEQIISEQHINSTGDGRPVGLDNLQDMGGIYPELDVGESSSEFQERITNYEFDQTQERVIYAPGKLVSLSTAVAVDGQLTEERINSIQSIVEAAIGFNPDRGDQIAVMSMTFDKTALQEMEDQMAVLAAQAKKEEQIKTYITWGFRGLAALFAFILLIILIRTLGEALKSEPVVVQPTALTSVEQEIEEKPKPKDEATRKQEKVKKIVQDKPEDTAALLKAWMMED
ncbi:MAG: flagellar basal-body MS-ring/collar protein FliF [Bacillota bacterium]